MISNYIVLDIPFTYREVASKYGAKWNPFYRVYTWRGERHNLPIPLTGFEAQPLSWSFYIEHVLNNNPFPVLNPSKVITPRQHQIVASNLITCAFQKGYPGYLLADEVGLGKTITAWHAILNLPTNRPLNIGIIAPLSVLAGWRNTILWMGNKGHRIILINYDRLRVFFEQNDNAKTLKGVSKYARSRNMDVMIWDECHYLKNLKAARTKLALSLYESTRFNLWLSATAGQNPLELGYLLPLLKSIVPGPSRGSTPLKQFEALCISLGLSVKRTSFGGWNWDNQSDDCKKMHNLLFKSSPSKIIPPAIRRKPQDIAGWPSLQRILQPIDLEAEEMQMYNLHWQDFLKEIQNKPINSKNKKALENGLVSVIRFRMKASLLRTSYTVDSIMNHLEDGYKVAVFCEYKGTINDISEKLKKKKVPHSIITGAVSDPKEREEQRKQFQAGKNQVILFNVQEGINLQEGEIIENDKPRIQIDHDITWSALKMHQTDGRCHRNGKFATVYWMYATNTKELRVIEVLLKKLKSMNTLSGDSNESINELEDIFNNILK